jgi:hypothetical protein
MFMVEPEDQVVVQLLTTMHKVTLQITVLTIPVLELQAKEIEVVTEDGPEATAVAAVKAA